MDFLEILQDRVTDMYFCNKENFTALKRASENGYVIFVEMMLLNSAHGNKQDERGANLISTSAAGMAMQL